MRLLTWNGRDTFSLTTDLTEDIPPYAILSHTWRADGGEVTFTDLQQDRARYRPGYAKIQFCGEQARKDGFQYFWVDTCCIDRANNNELTEAITSMYQWYHKAQKCYVYLADVSTRTNQPAWESTFRASRWFKRGWTLQELLAPRIVEFYSREGDFLGTKQRLVQQIHEITTIPLAALDGKPLSRFPIKERIRWTENRQTKKKEDQAYCLLGIFDVFMPLIYGEGDNALRRLQKEINERSEADLTASLRVTDQGPSLGLCLNSAPIISSSDFVGRTLEIATIYGLLRPDQASLEQHRVIIGGIGGMGKTQLAIAYARQYQNSYTSVFWLNATSQQSLYASFRSLAPRLITAEKLTRSDDVQLLIHIHRWLSQPYNAQWLLIFDNYDDPEQFSIDKFCPNIGHGSILITTRLPDLVTGQQVRIQPLHAVDDSLTILQARSGRLDTKQDQGARRLAERLAGLPLALVTAGTYLRKSIITFQQYLDAYNQRWQVDRRRPLKLPDYRDRTLYTTWDLTYRKLRADDLEAAQMLQLLAYFDNQDMWHALFRAGLSDRAPAWLGTIVNEDSGFSSVMSTLVDYCLIGIQHETKSYSMHSCVHDWVLGELNQEIDSELYWYAFDCVAASIEKDDWEALDRAKYTRLSPHGVQLTYHRFGACDQSVGGLSERLHDATWIATMLQKQAQFSAAEQMYERVLAECEKSVGASDTFTLATAHNLGTLYYDQGKLNESEQMYKRILVRRAEALDPEDSSIIHTANSLGILYFNQGKFDEAESMHKRAFAGYKKVLGPDHAWTLGAVNNLAVLYRTQGKLNEARQMYMQAMAGYKKILKTDNFSSLTVAANLCHLEHYQGRLDEAARMNDRVLKSCANFLQRGDCQRGIIQIYMQALSRSVKISSTNRPLSLLRILQLVKQWKDDSSLCQGAARAMVYYGDEKNAQEAYRYSIRRVHQQRADYHDTHCNMCSQWIVVEMGLHVCRQCWEVDLCDQCMASHTKGERVMAMCSGHDFFHVNKAASVVSDDIAVDNTAEMIAWVDKAIAEYTLAGPSDLQND